MAKIQSVASMPKRINDLIAVAESAREVRFGISIEGNTPGDVVLPEEVRWTIGGVQYLGSWFAFHTFPSAGLFDIVIELNINGAWVARTWQIEVFDDPTLPDEPTEIV